jgi:GWxTD domain-containing protein
MNKVKIKILFLSIIITVLSFSQNHSNSSDRSDSQNFRFLYSELNVFPSVNNNWVYNYTFRIPYNHLVFVKDDNGYKAGFSLVVEVTDTLGNFVDRQIKDDKIQVSDYQETDSDILFYQGLLTFHIPKGNYNFLPLITDINSKDELKPKKKENFTFTAKNINLLPPLVVNSKKVKCNNKDISVLTNYEGFVPFNNNSYDIIIPSIDTSFNNLKAIVINNEDTVFNNYLKESAVFSLNFQVCDSQIVIDQPGDMAPTRNFIIKNLCIQFSEGNITFLLFKGDEQKPYVTYYGQCLWFDKPFALTNPEFAIRILKYMTGEDEISKILSAKEKNYPKELYKFWKKYDPTPSTQYNEVMSEYYKRVDYTSKNFSSLSNKKGFDTDRGKIYIQFGNPKRIERSSNNEGKIVETWYYDQQKRFIFIDKQGTGEFSLQK